MSTSQFVVFVHFQAAWVEMPWINGIYVLQLMEWEISGQ